MLKTKRLEELYHQCEELIGAKGGSVVTNEVEGSVANNADSLEQETAEIMLEMEREVNWLCQRVECFFDRIGREVKERKDRYHQCYSDKEGRCTICRRVLD